MNLFFQHGASPRLQVAKDAATNGDLATIRRMVEREGYDVRTDLTGCAWTLAHAVAEKGHWECLRYLVCRDPSITRAKTLLGTTVLHTSVGSGCPIELVRLLVEKGARVDAVDGQGTVLHSCSNKELVQYFLQLGTPNPNIKNDEELTALGMAVYKKNFDVLKALVESGKADVDLQDFRGSTLLHLCVQTNPEVSILLYLLTKSKANINIRNNDRKTALDLAVPSSRERLLLLIADLGRSHIKSKKEKTQKRMELSKLLSRYFQLADSGALDPMSIIDFAAEESVLDKELISQAQPFFNQVFQSAMTSHDLGCMQRLLDKSMVHQGNPKWAPLRQDQNGKSKIWKSATQGSHDRLDKIKHQLGSEAYLSGLVEHQIASGSPSLLEQACQLSGEETLDILVWMLGKCPLLNFQKMAEENSAKFLSAAGQSPNSRMVEKLLRSELVPKDEGIKFCRENGYDDLLHRLDCNSLLVMTRAHSILATRSAETNNAAGVSESCHGFKESIEAAYLTKKNEPKEERSMLLTNSVQGRDIVCPRHRDGQQANCLSGLILTVQRFQDFLNSPAASPFARLRPRFKIAASMEDLDCAAVAENVSISIEFGDLRASDYSLAEGAMTMSSAERGQELMPLWIKKDNSVDMNELLQALLNSFQDFLKSNVEAFPEEVDLIKTQVEWSSCETCSEMKL